MADVYVPSYEEATFNIDVACGWDLATLDPAGDATLRQLYATGFTLTFLLESCYEYVFDEPKKYRGK